MMCTSSVGKVPSNHLFQISNELEEGGKVATGLGFSKPKIVTKDREHALIIREERRVEVAELMLKKGGSTLGLLLSPGQPGTQQRSARGSTKGRSGCDYCVHPTLRSSRLPVSTGWRAAARPLQTQLSCGLGITVRVLLPDRSSEAKSHIMAKQRKMRATLGTASLADLRG